MNNNNNIPGDQNSFSGRRKKAFSYLQNQKEKKEPLLILTGDESVAFKKEETEQLPAENKSLQNEINTEPALPQPVENLSESSPKKILFAEDNLLLRKSVSHFLTEKGFIVVQAANGAEAMDEIRSHTFDLLIIDLKMPRMDGIQVINNVRNELKLSTPVIVLTASGVEKVELESFTAGANDFVSKPFSPQTLMARIQKLTAING